jgi:hypothetical protein
MKMFKIHIDKFTAKWKIDLNHQHFSGDLYHHLYTLAFQQVIRDGVCMLLT